MAGGETLIAETPYELDQRGEDTDRLQRELANRLPDEVRRGHGAAQQAMTFVAKRRYREAEQQARVALNTPIRHSGHARYAMYAALQGQGKQDEALAQLEQIKVGELMPRRVFDALTAGYLRQGRWLEAERTVDAAIAQFGFEDPFLPSRIYVAVAADWPDRAQAAHARCREAKSEAIKVACDEAIAPLGLADLEPAAAPGLLDRLQAVLPQGGRKSLMERLGF